MYGIPDSVKPLSAAEEQVMLAVWACRAPATRRDIDEKLRAKGWAPATVLNFLYRPNLPSSFFTVSSFCFSCAA